MASFLPLSIKKLEEEIAHLNVYDLPLNPSMIVGEGASAIVYIHNLRKNTVAVKAFKRQVSKKKVMDIAHVLRKLENDNVVKFCGFSTKPSALLFEYCRVNVDGEKVHNLSSLLSIFNDNTYFNFKERLNYIFQATKGLIYLHNNGVVHRDFKPSNLLVSGSLNEISVKVADFDGMLLLKETITATATSFPTKGMTLSYTAPEICSGYVKTPSKKTDIFSWAISAYEILSDLSSPWQNVLPSLKDHLLTEALCKDIRPILDDVKNLYQTESIDATITISFIHSAWSGEPSERPELERVTEQYTNY